MALTGSFRLDLHGLQALDARLAGLPEALVQRAVDPALERGAQQVRTNAQGYIRSRSGRLARHLNVKRLRPKAHRVGYGVWSGTPSQLGITAGSQWYYPAHLALGHATPGHGRLRRARRVTARMLQLEFGTPHWVRARPFLRPALFNNQGAILTLIQNTLRSQLDRLGL